MDRRPEAADGVEHGVLADVVAHDGELQVLYFTVGLDEGCVHSGNTVTVGDVTGDGDDIRVVWLQEVDDESLDGRHSGVWAEADKTVRAPVGLAVEAPHFRRHHSPVSL